MIILKCGFQVCMLNCCVLMKKELDLLHSKAYILYTWLFHTPFTLVNTLSLPLTFLISNLGLNPKCSPSLLSEHLNPVIPHLRNPYISFLDSQLSQLLQIKHIKLKIHSEDPYVRKSMGHLSLQAWVRVFSIIFSNFIHLPEIFIIAFFSMAEKNAIVYSYHISIIQSSVNSHLG